LPQYKTSQTTDRQTTDRRQTTHCTIGSTDSTVGQKSISDVLRVRIKFMGQYGRTPLATAWLLVQHIIEMLLNIYEGH